jgi:trafficking protein particle complex subunit 9
VGKIKKSAFLRFVELLQVESVVRLSDVSPDPRPNRSKSCWIM